MSKKSARTTKPPTYSEWVNGNRGALITAFNKAFGRQIQEWPDFAEAAYAKAHPKNNDTPTNTGEAPNAAEIHR